MASVIDLYGKQNLPKIVVTDQSMALTNALHEAFNGFSFSSYLTWCYDVLFTLPMNNSLWQSTRVLHVYCASHLIANVVKKTNKTKHVDSVKQLFIFAFTLLQNSSTCGEFMDSLKAIYHLFTKKSDCRETKESLVFIQRSLGSRSLPDFFKQLDLGGVDSAEKVELETVYIEQEEDNLVNLKTKSPFTAYFSGKIERFDLDQEMQDQNCLNPFNAPDLYQIIDDLLHIMPMWSGVMLAQSKARDLRCATLGTRLTNNPVENYFGQVKHRLAREKHLLMPSVLIHHFLTSIKSKWVQFYKPTSPAPTVSFQKTNLAFENEKFKPRRQHRSNRNKGFFYKSSGKRMFAELTPSDDDEDDTSITGLVKATLLSTNEHKLLFQAKQQQLRHEIHLLRNKSLQTMYDANKHNSDPLTAVLSTDFPGFFPLRTPADGNCLYSAVSFALFGDFEHQGLIRFLALFTLYEYEPFFRELGNFSHLAALSATDKVYGDDTNVLAISILLNRSVAVLIERIKGPVYLIRFPSNSIQEPFYLGFVNKHFSLMLSKSTKVQLMEYYDRYQETFNSTLFRFEDYSSY